MRSAAALIEDIALRVGYFGLGAWLGELGTWLDAPQPFPPPVAPSQFVAASGHGLSVTLYVPSWEAGAPVPADAWVFYDATIARDLPLPLGLVADTETPDSAQTKLTSNVSWGQPAADGTRSVTYFLKDLRVVVVRFRPYLIGIASVTLTRLFTWPDWRQRTSKP